MTKVRLPKLVVAGLLGAALAVPTLLPATAAAQDHQGERQQSRDQDRRNREDAPRQRDRADDPRHPVDRDRDRTARDRDHRGDDRHRDDHRYGHDDHHRQTTKNDWRNLGYLGGAVGIAGLLTHNSTLAGLGLGGGLYSAYRYDQDRKSQDRDGRGRYALFSHRSFDHDGHHYERRERMKGGQKYYYFSRTH